LRAALIHEMGRVCLVISPRFHVVKYDNECQWVWYTTKSKT
jgi:hypothetical protein